MTQHRLTDRSVKHAKIGKHPDGGGLYLQVSPGKEGRQPNKSWVFRYATGEIKISKKAGKRYKAGQWMGIGAYPDVSLAAAREKAADARKLRQQGMDPIIVRDAGRAAQAVAAAKSKTFSECQAGYVLDHEKGWGATHRRAWLAAMRDYATPVIGSIPVAMVDTPLVLKILRPIWLTQHPTAVRLRPRIEAVLDWAAAHHYREGVNPARWKGHLDQILDKTDNVHVVVHHRELPYTEIYGLVAELMPRNKQGELMPRKDRDVLCLLLLILTGVRVGAAVGARMEEFDLANRIWTVPAVRAKRRGKRKNMSFRVPLSNAAIKVIKSVDVTTGALFPSADHTSLAKAHGRKGFTIHGFRSSLKTWAEEQTNHANEIIEMALGHAVGDETEEAYRRGDALEKRAKLMADWATYCTSPPADNVVPLHKSA